MSKRVLDVGQCSVDHASIRRLVEGQFGAEIVQTQGIDDTLTRLADERFDLVLVNRKLDADYSDGLNVIRAIKSEAPLSSMPVMLVSNYPDAQEAAVAAGAVCGFGKAELGQAATREKLRPYLEAS